LDALDGDSAPSGGETVSSPTAKGYERYWDAVRRRVCAVCLDGRDDGTCGLAGRRSCALEDLLPRIVDTIREVRQARDDAYAAAVEARVCSRCPDNGPLGRCALRRDGTCALGVFLPLVIAAVAEVDGA
jgi:hypothetical protein